MTLLRIPEKVIVVNTKSRFVPSFDGANPEDSSTVTIPGYGMSKIGKIKRVHIARGLRPVVDRISVTFGAASADEIMHLDLALRSVDREFELARPDYQAGATTSFSVAIANGDTGAEIATKFASVVDATSGAVRDKMVIATVNAAVVTLSINQPTSYSKRNLGVYFDIYASGIRNKEGDKVMVTRTGASQMVGTAGATATVDRVQVFHKGIGYGANLEAREKHQPGHSSPYSHEFSEIPAEDGLYTMIAWDFEVDRPSPTQDQNISPVRRQVAYLNEQSMSSEIDDMIDFLLTDMATRAYKLDPEGVSVGFNDAEALSTSAATTTANTFDSDFVELFPVLGVLPGTDTKYVTVVSTAVPDTATSAELVSKAKENA